MLKRERFRLTAKDTLEYEAKVENPSVFSRPFTVRVPLRRRPVDMELLEYCAQHHALRRHH